MVGRFTARRAATPDAPAPEEPPSSELEGVSWTVFPDSGSEQGAAAQQSETELLRQREKISRSLDRCEQLIREGKIQTDSLNLATIAIACAIGYLNFRRVSPGWCVDRPLLVKLADTLFSRESFARTEPPKA